MPADLHVMYNNESSSFSYSLYDAILSLCSEGEESMTKEEYTKMKQELEAWV